MKTKITVLSNLEQKLKPNQEIKYTSCCLKSKISYTNLIKLNVKCKENLAILCQWNMDHPMKGVNFRSIYLLLEGLLDFCSPYTEECMAKEETQDLRTKTLKVEVDLVAVAEWVIWWIWVNQTRLCSVLIKKLEQNSSMLPVCKMQSKKS